MNLLSIEHLTKAYSERKLFDDTDFYLQENEKVGIIGINGTGKSTLLKIMAGQEETDEGTVTVANHVVIGYLPQHPLFDPEMKALDCVLAGHAQSYLGRAARLGEADYTAMQDAADRNDLTTRAKTMMTKLGITNFDQKAGELSGGQRKRLALVSVLLKEADILILDEPTNHLDNEMADWLEEQLKNRRCALVMVTHDRYFLDSVCNRIVEVDKGKIYSYQENYSGFLELKAQREEMAQASERKRQSILRTELAWVQRGARARSTKQKARLERYEELKSRQAPAADGQVELGSVSSRLGRTTVEISNLCKGYGDRQLINNFNYIFLKNDRVGFIGTNGCGKTTLMKMLTGQEMPDSGEIVVGQTVKIGYYAQEVTHMDPNERVIDYIRDVAEVIQTSDGRISASQLLERFLFDGSAQYSLIGKLSGGEKRRLNLCRVLMGAPKVLILDEPTNDLDITTLTILEDYLDHFDGIVIIVSHDRYFLDRCVQRIFAFEEDGVLRQYEGSYSDYALRKSVEAAMETGLLDKKSPGTTGKNAGGADQKAGLAAESETDKKNGRKKSPRKLKFTYMEQKEYDTIETDIAALEEKIETLEADIIKAATDFVKLNKLTKEKEETEKQLEEKMDRWMFLEDKAARIEAGEMEEN